ncbi:ethanolamine ammonia-lyase subunit EutC [Pseudoalteromonas sp. CST5]|uniref:ethanolamine ammonia-lyase subunit EutC n=1 Tax=unclassified Pseudoalteromonas TaxID=194690 RepID=UPI0023596B19|nr:MULTISPECIES: ethanolamine ammonia-lyase subunit EutC [unclassified Pseudoalteromonas]MDC9515497.1 ethanolamine ammonia-lyase subunit EutC [Pseudoalteromonas sp. CST1]MDC9539729.1 ethanolamine ammonia-lyase subunit EutC [Pseudoalteromonas sp. CST3]MDC9543595.1 ethanolamine ammonia-lyase subunit EutC [Pseudoalteromonas sp. CST2]MDC9547381.1 ethanolamine ammonia-lyase subunit EutC [Pseudoalteromonas sp. CST4]MDC9551377.1 ethanolamine ammonia-lyase subunit EutC [Pseudoalteromonas sp. CST5]
MKAVKSINTQSSNDHDNGKVVENPWSDLRRFTDARIGLGRAGISLPTAEMLAFQLSHAQARDAVNFPLDISEMAKTLSAIDALSEAEKPLSVQSEAVDRVTYLQRPDLGRKLNQAGRTTLLNTMQSRQSRTQAQYDLAIVVVDGLSSLAVQKNAAPFISELLKQLPTEPSPYKIAPITLVEQGRVAIGDDIGELLNAQVVMVLIGERPGLSSPDSLGLYLTWEPKTGLNDACRNCISNIRPAGLSYFEAARRAVYLLQEAKKCGLTGVNLKDRTQDDVIEHQVQTTNFLIAE